MAIDGIDPTFINSPSESSPPLYDAEELRRDFSGLMAPGATIGGGRGGVLDSRGLVVSLAGSNINVTAGPVSVDSQRGNYLSGLAAPGTVDTLVPADGTNPRRDRVIFQVMDPDNPDSDIPSGGTNRKAVVRYLPGTPNPSASTGGGMAGLPGLAEDLFWIDVPRSGQGSPALTDVRRFSAAAGGAVPVTSLSQARALPKVKGSMRLRLDLPGAPLQMCDGTNWVHHGPWIRTVLNTGTMANTVGNTSRLLATIPMTTQPYAREIKLHLQTAALGGAISNGVLTEFAAASVTVSQASSAQVQIPLAWTNPGNYLTSGCGESEIITIPANADPLARMWAVRSTGSVNTSYSVDARITKFWIEERPAPEAA